MRPLKVYMWITISLHGHPAQRKRLCSAAHGSCQKPTPRMCSPNCGAVSSLTLFKIPKCKQIQKGPLLRLI